jgi:thiamine biosynthesis lipoprotein
MGTDIRIVLYARNAGAAQHAERAAFAEVAAVDAALSDYRPDSEVSRISDAAGRSAVVVGPRTIEALQAAISFAVVTGGAFDPTVGPLSVVWRKSRATGRPPSAAAARKAASLVGWKDLMITGSTARLARSGMRLDLGGIGKGFACDRALDVLAGAGVRRALVACGGDFAVGDPPPGSSGWRIAIEGGPVLLLAHTGVSTSGDTQQYLVVGGKKLSHIFDPRTGAPISGMGLVTVVAENATASDALATAFSVMGPFEGLRLATVRSRTYARIRWREGVVTRTVMTPGFDALVAPANR